jgi:hypothetical protein
VAAKTAREILKILPMMSMIAHSFKPSTSDLIHLGKAAQITKEATLPEFSTSAAIPVYKVRSHRGTPPGFPCYHTIRLDTSLNSNGFMIRLNGALATELPAIYEINYR